MRDFSDPERKQPLEWSKGKVLMMPPFDAALGNYLSLGTLYGRAVEKSFWRASQGVSVQQGKHIVLSTG